MWNLQGGSPQGSLIGQDWFIVNSNDNTEDMEDDDIFKYIDNLNTLESIVMASLLQEYDYRSHLPNDIGVNDKFLPPHTFQIQENLNSISKSKSYEAELQKK